MKRATIFLSLLSLMTGGLLAQNSYTFASIDYPSAVLTNAYEISDTGVIVGSFRLPGKVQRAFLLRHGNFTELPTPDPDAGLTQARGLNDRGQIVGRFFGNSDSSEHGFLLSSGSGTRLDFPGAAASDAFDVNNLGSIVGLLADGSGLLHGWIRKAGTYARIDVPGALDTVAFAINDLGQIVGGWDTAPNTLLGHSFLLDHGAFTSYDVSASIGGGSQFNRINDAGDIIGTFQDNATGALRGFLLQGGIKGQFVELDYPAATETIPWGINNAGMIVGSYVDADGFRHGFLATPSRAL